MADEIEVNLSVRYDDTVITDFFESIAGMLDSVALKRLRAQQTIGFSAEEALIIGEITSPVLLAVVNLDATNFVNLKVATGGAIMAKLWPGVANVITLGSGAQAPYLIADTAACKIDYLLIG